MCYYTMKTFSLCAKSDFTMQNRIGRIGKPIYTYIICVYMYVIIEKFKKKFYKKSHVTGGAKKN